MGQENLIFGFIRGLGFHKHQLASDGGYGLADRNAEAINSLPVNDEWPPLSRSMFGASFNEREIYGGQVIHFGAAFKNIDEDDEDWQLWLKKFENLLSKMWWYHAQVCSSQEIRGNFVYVWEPTGDEIDRIISGKDLTPVQKWGKAKLDQEVHFFCRHAEPNKTRDADAKK